MPTKAPPSAAGITEDPEAQHARRMMALGLFLVAVSITGSVVYDNRYAIMVKVQNAYTALVHPHKNKFQCECCRSWVKKSRYQ